MCLSTDKEEMKSINTKDMLQSIRNRDIDSDRSSNSKMIFKDIDGKIVYEDEYGRNSTGCPRDYDKDGIYHAPIGTNSRPDYIIEVMYDYMFGSFDENNKGLFGVIFDWILYPGDYVYCLWNFYHTVTGDGWTEDPDGSTKKSFDEFKFDMEVFLKKEEEYLEYYIRRFLIKPQPKP